jgi:phospholipid/cholesterol/gamma-HCH transport system permease protein
VSDPAETVIAVEDPLEGDGAIAAAGRIGAAIAAAPGPVVLDLAGVRTVDTFGMAALGEAVRRCRREGRPLRLANPPKAVERLASFLRLDRVLASEVAPAARPRQGPVLAAGDAFLRLRDYMVTLLGMTADAYRHAFVDPFRGDAVRREQFLRQLAEAGAGAVPIVVLINFMLGLILAFQMAYVFKDYGATALIANIVGVAVTRELGPLIAAILVAGRSGSAMAAEIGTMVVTEEVDALQMMALKPRRFLLVPRFAALALSVPALCVFADLAGILGGAFVGIATYDIGPYTYYSKTVGSLGVTDITTGLLKSFFFGNIVAVIGCLHGLRLRGGPEAVGKAATTAVVESIIAVIVFDALFTTVVYYII